MMLISYQEYVSVSQCVMFEQCKSGWVCGRVGKGHRNDGLQVESPPEGYILQAKYTNSRHLQVNIM